MAQQRQHRHFTEFQLVRIGCTSDPDMPKYKFWLHDGVTALGRHENCDIPVSTSYASRDHCKFTVIGNIVQVSDNTSRNGTYVNQKQIFGPRKISVGDIVGIGCGFTDIKTLSMSSMYLAFKLVRQAMVTGDLVEISDNEDEPVICLDSDEEVSVSHNLRNDIAGGAASANCNSDLDSEADDENVDNASMILCQDSQIEFKQEMRHLDDYVWDIEHNPTAVKVEIKTETSDFEFYDRYDSESPPGMLHLQTDDTDLPTSPNHSEEPEASEELSGVVEEIEEIVDRKPNIALLFCPGEEIEIFDDDDQTLRNWKSRLSQKSDTGIRKPSQVMSESEHTPHTAHDSSPDVSDDRSSVEPAIPKHVEDDCQPSVVASKATKRTHENSFFKTKSDGKPKKNKSIKPCSVSLQRLSPDKYSTAHTRTTDKDKSPPPKSTECAVPINPIVVPPVEAEVPALAPALPKDLTPLVKVLKRRQSISEKRSVQLTDAHHIVKRRQSVSGRSNNPKSLNKVRASLNVDSLKESFKNAKHKVKETVDDRREKLRLLAEANKKPTPEPVRTMTKPKVKNTPYRGAFLTDQSSLPPKPSELKKKTAAATNSHKPNDAQPRFLEDVQQSEKERLLKSLQPKTHFRSLNETTKKVIEEFIHTSSATNTMPYGITREEIAKVAEPAAIIEAPLNIRLTTDAQELEFAAELSKYRVVVGTVVPGVRSILRASHSSQRAQRPRSFRFAERLLEIREFTRDSETGGDVPTAPAAPLPALDAIASGSRQPTTAIATAGQPAPQQRTRSAEDNPLNEIINDITGWNPDWLNGNPDAPNVNDKDYEPTPMLHNYRDFDSYLQNIIPILKMEVWQSIHNEAARADKTGIRISVNHVEHLRRSRQFRYVFRCQVDMPQNTLVEDNLVLVTYSQGSIPYKFLALIMQKQVVPSPMSNQLTTVFTMESRNVTANALNHNTPFVEIQILSHLMVELKQFQSILELNTTPLLHQILRPADFSLSRLNMHSMPYEYKGHHILNEEQGQIVQQICYLWAQNSSSINLVDGPPGTGKSRLINNLLIQFMFGHTPSRPRKILVCAHSNAAVDVIGRGLLKIQRQTADRPSRKFSLIRFGVLEKIHPDVKCVSLEEVMKRGKPIPAMEQERAHLKLKLAAKRVAKGGSAIKRALDEKYFSGRIELVEKAIARSREARHNSHHSHAEMQYHLNSADIVLTTLNSCAKLVRHMSAVDICIVDESTQCTEPSILLPLTLGVRSLVLVGDTNQLPGTVLSRQAARLGLTKSLFDRIRNAFVQPAGCPVFSLSRQYRMHREICSWPNRTFYGGRLVSDPKATDHPQFRLRPYTVLDLPFVHSERRGAGGRGQHELSNVKEADFVERLLRLLTAGIADQRCTIGVITPYAKQRDELRRRLREIGRCTVDTIDSFQGQERDVVVISNTRSHGVGFLNPERLNVALTRARACLIVCGNFGNIRKQDPLWQSFVDDAAGRKCLQYWRQDGGDEAFRAQFLEHLVKPDCRHYFDAANGTK